MYTRVDNIWKNHVAQWETWTLNSWPMSSMRKFFYYCQCQAKIDNISVISSFLIKIQHPPRGVKLPSITMVTVRFTLAVSPTCSLCERSRVGPARLWRQQRNRIRWSCGKVGRLSLFHSYCMSVWLLSGMWDGILGAGYIGWWGFFFYLFDLFIYLLFSLVIFSFCKTLNNISQPRWVWNLLI